MWYVSSPLQCVGIAGDCASVQSRIYRQCNSIAGGCAIGIRIRWCHPATYTKQWHSPIRTCTSTNEPTVCPKPTRCRFIYTQYMYSTNISISAKHNFNAIVVEEQPDTCTIVFQITTNLNQNVRQYQRTLCSSKSNRIWFHNTYAIYVFSQH